MTLLKKESEAPRKFMRAPESETPDDAEPTIFAYRGDSSPWHVLPPVIRGGNPVAANDIIDLNPGPSGELFCLVRANPTNHLLRIGGTSDVTTWSWEDIGAIPTGLSDVKSVIVYGGRIYAIWGPARTNLSSSELGKPLWKTEIVTAGTPIQRLLATSAVTGEGSSYLVASIGTETAYRSSNGWIRILDESPPKETTIDDNGEEVSTNDNVDPNEFEVLDSAYGLFGVWLDTHTIYYLNKGNWKALPPIPDYYMESGKLKRRPGYAKDITDITVDEDTGAVVVTLNPPEGPVEIPLTVDEAFKPVPKQYYLAGKLETESGDYLNPVSIAVGGPANVSYINYKVTGEW